MKFKLKKIDKIEKIPYKGNVYDLTVEEDHSYVANNIIVHNSICSTRLNTGFGVPLLTAVEDCAQVKDKAYLIADGGIKNPGDIAKAIAFGADFAMMGRMIAATDLGPGRCYSAEGDFVCLYNQMHLNDNESRTKFKEYRGMASREAREGVLKYASIEGVAGIIEYKCTTEQFLTDIELNLRASLSYAGASNWSEFRRSVKKIRITSASLSESMTHVTNHK